MRIISGTQPQLSSQCYLQITLANKSWLNLFTNATVETLVVPTSNNYLILLNWSSMPWPHLHKCNFPYENVWHLEPWFREFVTYSWHIHFSNFIIPKLLSCAADISAWSKVHCNKLKIDIEDCHCQMKNFYLNSSCHGQTQMFELHKRRLLFQDDTYWCQHAKTHWYRDVDRNTKYLHCSSTASKKVNHIISLKMILEIKLRMIRVYVT